MSPSRPSPPPPRPGRPLVRALASSATLLVLAVAVGCVLAAGLGAAVWGIATALHHAANN